MTRGETIRKAIALKSDEDVIDALRRDLPDSLEMLARIACGDVPRNAQQILKGIELQLRFSQPLPKTTIEHQGQVGVAVIDPYALPPADSAALPAPPVAALPPIVRRAGAPEARALALPARVTHVPGCDRGVDCRCGAETVLCGRCGLPLEEPHECPPTPAPAVGS
jgi:hypothetical protein